MPSGLRNGARAPVAFNLRTVSVFQLPSKLQEVDPRYVPLHEIIILLQPRIIHPARFSAPVALVDVNAHVDRPDPLLGMALDLWHDVLAGQGRPVEISAQGVDDVAEGFIAGYGAVGVLDPDFDRTQDLALVSGKGGSVDGDLGRFGRHGSEVCVCVCV